MSPYPWDGPLGLPGGENDIKVTFMGVSRFLTSKIKTVFAYKRGLEKVFWGNNHLYVEVFGYAHPKITTRTPRNPFWVRFLAIFRFDKKIFSYFL